MGTRHPSLSLQHLMVNASRALNKLVVEQFASRVERVSMLKEKLCSRCFIFRRHIESRNAVDIASSNTRKTLFRKNKLPSQLLPSLTQTVHGNISRAALMISSILRISLPGYRPA